MSEVRVIGEVNGTKDSKIPLIERHQVGPIYVDYLVNLAVLPGIVGLELGAVELAQDGASSVSIQARLRIAPELIDEIARTIDEKRKSLSPPSDQNEIN